MKKKITNDIKAAIMLIVAEDIIALRNVIRTITKSASKLLGDNGGSILSGGKKKGKYYCDALKNFKKN